MIKNNQNLGDAEIQILSSPFIHTILKIPMSKSNLIFEEIRVVPNLIKLLLVLTVLT
jgi:hypothetical protein